MSRHPEVASIQQRPGRLIQKVDGNVTFGTEKNMDLDRSTEYTLENELDGTQEWRWIVDGR